MALSPLGMLLVIATILLPFNIVVAKEFVVGDDHGWTIGFDYAAWAADKTFQVGDLLGKFNSSNYFIVCSLLLISFKNLNVKF